MTINNGAEMSKNLNLAYIEGQRCAHDGLCITAGKYDYVAMRKIFDMNIVAREADFCVGLDRDESFEAWQDGFFDELDRLDHLSMGLFQCGRPI